MNTRKEYPTFEELWTCCAQEESRISAKEKSQKKYDDQAFIEKFKNFMNKRKFVLRKKPNQENDMSKIQCFNCRKYGHYRNHCPELKKRKETHEAIVPKKRNPQRKLSKMKQTSSSSRGNNILL
jgi:phage terminase small subunit